jgi:methylated-DNA-[protein]-cysteine S-methyltransferase
MAYLSMHTPVGDLTLHEERGALVSLDWGWAEDISDEKQAPHPILVGAQKFLNNYFGRQCRKFDLPVAPMGTPFQQAVWKAILSVPAGQTRTYGQIVKLTGGSAQSVGTACGANPIPIIIPCHRVIGARSLGGYSGNGGVETKCQLLRLEGIQIAEPQF